MQPIKSMSQKKGHGSSRGFERRAAGTATYYKLATWDARSFTFKDGKVAFETRAEAGWAATKPGRYRISEVSDSGRTDFEPFDI